MSDLMLEGLNLALYGMGFVFVFLLLLVSLTNLMSKVIGRYWPAIPAPARRRATQKPPASNASPKRASDADDTKTVAVIAAAIKQHRAGSR
jgi:oxaloacetate decarboxylase (Na+ extruding) subunit gamma